MRKKPNGRDIFATRGGRYTRNHITVLIELNLGNAEFLQLGYYYPRQLTLPLGRRRVGITSIGCGMHLHVAGESCEQILLKPLSFVFKRLETVPGMYHALDGIKLPVRAQAVLSRV